jgi:hypothetical protein
MIGTLSMLLIRVTLFFFLRSPPSFDSRHHTDAVGGHAATEWEVPRQPLPIQRDVPPPPSHSDMRHREDSESRGHHDRDRHRRKRSRSLSRDRDDSRNRRRR